MHGQTEPYMDTPERTGDMDIDSKYIRELISRLKTKITAGDTNIKDVDSLNVICTYVGMLEEEPHKDTTGRARRKFRAMAPINIENINIYINENKNEK